MWTFFLHAVEWDRRANTVSGGADPRNPPGAAIVGPTEPPAHRRPAATRRPAVTAAPAAATAPAAAMH
jgi:hypothetical protein